DNKIGKAASVISWRLLEIPFDRDGAIQAERVPAKDPIHARIDVDGVTSTAKSVAISNDIADWDAVSSGAQTERDAFTGPNNIGESGSAAPLIWHSVDEMHCRGRPFSSICVFRIK